MKSQLLHTLWCNITGEATGESWTWSLLGVKGLKDSIFGIPLVEHGPGHPYLGILTQSSSSPPDSGPTRTTSVPAPPLCSFPACPTGKSTWLVNMAAFGVWPEFCAVYSEYHSCFRPGGPIFGAAAWPFALEYFWAMQGTSHWPKPVI